MYVSVENHWSFELAVSEVLRNAKQYPLEMVELIWLIAGAISNARRLNWVPIKPEKLNERIFAQHARFIDLFTPVVVPPLGVAPSPALVVRVNSLRDWLGRNAEACARALCLALIYRTERLAGAQGPVVAAPARDVERAYTDDDVEHSDVEVDLELDTDAHEQLDFTGEEYRPSLSRAFAFVRNGHIGLVSFDVAGDTLSCAVSMLPSQRRGVYKLGLVARRSGSNIDVIESVCQKGCRSSDGWCAHKGALAIALGEVASGDRTVVAARKRFDVHELVRSLPLAKVAVSCSEGVFSNLPLPISEKALDYSKFRTQLESSNDDASRFTCFQERCSKTYALAIVAAKHMCEKHADKVLQWLTPEMRAGQTSASIAKLGDEKTSGRERSPVLAALVSHIVALQRKAQQADDAIVAGE